MSFSNRRFVLLGLAATPLAGCGFTPVYGPGGAGNAIRNRIRVEPPQNRLEFELVSRLEDRLGRADTPSYILTYGLETDETGLAITGADDVTRVNISGTLSFAVTEADSDVQVQAGSVSTFSAFANTGTPVATTAARRDAEDRLMLALADQLVSRLLAGAHRWA